MWYYVCAKEVPLWKAAVWWGWRRQRGGRGRLGFGSKVGEEGVAAESDPGKC